MAEQAQKQDIKYFVRIASTDLEGRKPIAQALKKIKGISDMYSNAICVVAGVDHNKRAGELSDAQVKKLDEVLADPAKHKIPAWIFNKRKDPEDGQDKHLITTNLAFIEDNTLKMMKKLRHYKGVRHAAGLPVRGQRTKANFRRNKGKVTGVKRRAGAKTGK